MQTGMLTLENGKFHLRLAPEIGGSVASWEFNSSLGGLPLFRPWDGKSGDLYTTACFPLVPWSNRITQGGFEHEGRFHPVANNRDGEAYPIHGDGWLQSWRVDHARREEALLSLESNGFGGNPYHYRATQHFRLLPNGLTIDLTVTHLGEGTLPYGLGLHPYFPRTEATRLQFKSSGVWTSGEDPIPTGFTETLPPTFDYNQPAPLKGPLIDHCFAGWDGKADIIYPDRGFTLTMLMESSPGYTLMYRPPDFDFFCLEPITQPIDAFHMPGKPGLKILGHGESFTLHATFLLGPAPAQAVVG